MRHLYEVDAAVRGGGCESGPPGADRSYLGFWGVSSERERMDQCRTDKVIDRRLWGIKKLDHFVIITRHSILDVRNTLGGPFERLKAPISFWRGSVY